MLRVLQLQVPYVIDWTSTKNRQQENDWMIAEEAFIFDKRLFYSVTTRE
jgi:hypothetical protein